MRRAVALALLAILGPSCGVPRTSDVHVEERGAVPFGLLDERGSPPGAQGGAASLDVFLVAGDGGALVPVTRRADDVTLEAVMEELGAGPTEPEAALGLRSAVSDGNLLAGAELDGGIAAVDLTEDFSSLSGTEQLLAIGQVVLSLTARPGVGRVVFTLDGERVEVPRGDGALTSGSVSRDTYLALLDGGDELARPAGAPTGSVADMVAGAQ